MDRMIHRFQEWMEQYSETGKPMSLDAWFAYQAFDILGQVVFARPFGFLEKGSDIDNSIANSEMLSRFTAYTPFYRTLRNVLLTNPVMTWLQILPMGHVFNTAMAAVNEREKSTDDQSQFVIVDH